MTDDDITTVHGERVSAERCFDLQAKALGYWQVTEHLDGDYTHYLTRNEWDANGLTDSLLREYAGTDVSVTVQSPDEWEART